MKVITRTAKRLECQLGCFSPVGIYLCWPGELQALCPRHLREVKLDGPVELVVDLTRRNGRTMEGQDDKTL